jgi:hypothetical protein
MVLDLIDLFRRDELAPARLVPGLPPRFRPVGPICRFTIPGGSLDGGLDEFEEFCLSCATSARKADTTSIKSAMTRACSAYLFLHAEWSATNTVDHVQARMSIPDR